MIILDRDGVINYESDAYIKNADEWIPIPGSVEAIARLYKAGHRVVIATNQAGLGRGYYTVDDLEGIHKKLLSELAKMGGHVEKIYYCPHHPDEACTCRKPAPGLLLQIQKDFNVDLSHCLMIGDSLRDLQAAKAVDCPAWLVLTGNGAALLESGEVPENVPVFKDLSEAVDFLVPGLDQST